MNITEYKSFILGILSYKNQGNNIEGLIKILVEDDLRKRPYAVLEYVDREFEKHLDGNNIIRYQVVTIIFTKLTEDNLADIKLAGKLISISSNVQISISIPWLLSISESTLENASIAQSKAKLILRREGIISNDVAIEEMKQAFYSRENNFKRSDAEDSLNMYENKYISILQSTNLVLKRILGNSDKNLEKKTLEEQKKHWMNQIDELIKLEDEKLKEKKEKK